MNAEDYAWLIAGTAATAITLIICLTVLRFGRRP